MQGFLARNELLRHGVPFTVSIQLCIIYVQTRFYFLRPPLELHTSTRQGGHGLGLKVTVEGWL